MTPVYLHPHSRYEAENPKGQELIHCSMKPKAWSASPDSQIIIIMNENGRIDLTSGQTSDYNFISGSLFGKLMLEVLGRIIPSRIVTVNHHFTV